MEHPYRNQEQAKKNLSAGDYILFSYGGGAINSGTVDFLDGNIVRISNINGDGDSTVIPTKSITLYYDTQWEDCDADQETDRRRSPGKDQKPKRKRVSRAKYQKGDKITSLDELMSQKLVYFFDKITPHGWFQAWQMGLADRYIKMGALFKAVRKEDADVPRRKEDKGTGNGTGGDGESSGSL